MRKLVIVFFGSILVLSSAFSADTVSFSGELRVLKCHIPTQVCAPPDLGAENLDVELAPHPKEPSIYIGPNETSGY